MLLRADEVRLPAHGGDLPGPRRRDRGRHQAGRGGAGRGQAALEQYRAQLAEARTEAARIRDEARAEGQRSARRCSPRRTRSPTGSSRPARSSWPAARQQVVRELRGEIGTLAVDLAGRIVGESLADEARRRGTVDRFLAELDGMTRRRPARAPADGGLQPGRARAGARALALPGRAGCERVTRSRQPRPTRCSTWPTSCSPSPSCSTASPAAPGAVRPVRQPDDRAGAGRPAARRQVVGDDRSTCSRPWPGALVAPDRPARRHRARSASRRCWPPPTRAASWTTSRTSCSASAGSSTATASSAAARRPAAPRRGQGRAARPLLGGKVNPVTGAAAHVLTGPHVGTRRRPRSSGCPTAASRRRGRSVAYVTAAVAADRGPGAAADRRRSAASTAGPSR